jgi:hypothetical protein
MMPRQIPLVLPDTQIRALIDAANRGYDTMPPGAMKRAADRGVRALDRALDAADAKRAEREAAA